MADFSASIEARYTENIVIDDSLDIRAVEDRYNYYAAQMGNGIDFGCKRIMLETMDGVRCPTKYSVKQMEKFASSGTRVAKATAIALSVAACI